MGFQNIKVEKKDGIGKIILNRPEIMNPLNWQTISELGEAVADVERDDAVKVVIITGSGRAFSAGGDLKFLDDVREKPSRMDDFSQLFFRVFGDLEDLPKPVIASINGMALAGGMELVMVCDLAIASEDAKLGDQHINFAIIPGGGGTQRLPRIVGLRRAKEILYTGKWISAAEAERIGLVNQVVPADKLEEATMELAKTLLGKSRSALRTIKGLANWGTRGELYAALQHELQAASKHLFADEDTAEGLRAFIEKRKPNFK